MNILEKILKKVEKIDFLFPNCFEELMNNEYYDYDKFEWFLFHFFKLQDASVEKIGKKGKGDGGADLIVTLPHENGGIRRIGVQAKYWKNRVGTEPINQLASAKSTHNLTDLWLITTSDLTTDAKGISERMQIKVLRKEDVIEFIEAIKTKHQDDMDKNGVSSISFLEPKDTGQNIGIKPALFDFKNIKSITQDNNKIDFEIIKEIRIEIAKNHKLFPVYNVFTNDVANEIASMKPRSLEELLTIKGIGNKKADLFGKELIEMLNEKFPIKIEKNNDEELLKLLLEERKKIAKYNKIDEKDVYSDKVAEYLVKMRPKNKEILSKVYGFKQENIEVFGDYLIKCLKKFEESNFK